MKWLIACECSGLVRDACRALGVEAWSCDIFPSRRPSPYHFECDVRQILHLPWDGLIAFPVCKYLTNAGVRWLHTEPGRWDLMEDGCRFYNLFRDATHIPQRAVENPVQHQYAAARTGHCAANGVQFVHPFHFGDPVQKATGFRLFGLPPLTRTHARGDYPDGTIRQEVWLMGPGPDREEKRSETKPGMANAMARDWALAGLERAI